MLPSLGVVPEIRSAWGNGVFLSPLDLLRPQPQFFLALARALFACKGWCSAFAPVVLDRDKNESRRAECGQQKNEQDHPGETRHGSKVYFDIYTYGAKARNAAVSPCGAVL